MNYQRSFRVKPFLCLLFLWPIPFLSRSQEDYRLQTDGVVNTTLIKNNKLIIGGNFNQVGPYRGSLLAIPTSTGNADLTWPIVNNTVYCAISDGAGGAFIGGFFSQVGNYNRQGLAHLLADGSVDPNWVADVQGTVFSLCLSGSILYVGGSFVGINNGNGIVTRNRLAAVNASTGLVTAWNPNLNNVVYALAVSPSGDTVYAGGQFNQVNGSVSRTGVAAFFANTMTNNVVTTWNPSLLYTTTPASTAVYSLLLTGGQLYVGGDFTTINTTITRKSLAALDPATAAVSAWNPMLNARVLCMAAIGNTLYVGGAFNNANMTPTWLATQPRNGLAAINIASGSMGAVTTWNPNAGTVNGIVRSMAVVGSTIYISGDFTLLGNPSPRDRYRLAAINLSGFGGYVLPFTDGLLNNAASIYAVAATTHPVTGVTTILSGGNFTSFGGAARRNLAAFDLTTSAPTLLPWNPSADGPVYSLATSVTGDTVYVGGRFGAAGATPRNNLAALGLATNTNNATTWNPNVNDSVLAITVSVTGDTIYAGGKFTTAGGQPRNYIAAFNRTNGMLPTPWNPVANAPVRALALDHTTNRLFIGGDFTLIGGITRKYGAALDVTQPAALVTTWDPDLDNRIRTINLAPGLAYIGGDFKRVKSSTASPLNRNYLVAFTTSNDIATPTGWNPAADGSVHSLLVTDFIVYAGGSFNTMGGVIHNRLAAIDLQGNNTAWIHYLNFGTVTTLAGWGNNLYLGGNFSTLLDGDLVYYFAAIAPFTPFPLPFHLQDFKIQRVSDRIITSWNVVEEPAGIRYTVESSRDGNSFSIVGSLAGMGNTNYVFTDPASASSGVSFYRLKMSLSDGRIRYSPVQRIGADNDRLPIKNVVSVKNGLFVFPPSMNGAEMLLFNSAGQVVLRKRLSNGQNRIPLPTLPGGIYIYHILPLVPSSGSSGKIVL